MKVRVLGFDWFSGEGVSIEDVLQRINASTVRQEPYLLGATKKDGYWVGILLAVRDQKIFAKMVTDRGEFEIKTQALGRNENPVEFNFFLINPITGRGLYQHYHHSTSLNTFCRLAKRVYEDIRQSRMNMELKAVNSAKDQKRVRAAYKGSLTYQIWVSPDSFEDAVEKLERIRSTEVQLASVSAGGHGYLPAPQFCRTEWRRYAVDKTAPHQAVVAWARTLAADTGLVKAVKVRGVDPDGNDVLVNLEKNVEHLALLKFDEAVKDLMIQSSDLNSTILSSHMATRLISIAQSPAVDAMLRTPITKE